MTDRTPIQGERFYCPLCDSLVHLSSYLHVIFSSPRGEWFANMVTHYRHHHIVYYNHSVHWQSWHGHYDEFKHEVNERAKRQILRKCTRYLREYGFTANDLDLLLGTTPETRALALQLLGGAPPPPPPRSSLTLGSPCGETAQSRLERFLGRMGVGR